MFNLKNEQRNTSKSVLRTYFFEIEMYELAALHDLCPW